MFNALENHFYEQKFNSITVDNMPWIVEPGTVITIKGRAKTPLLNDILVFTPSLKFLELEIVPDGDLVINPGIQIEL